MIYRIFSEQMIESVGWAVVHSLWQSTLIAIALAIAFAFIQKRKAGIRYNLAYGGLILAFLAFVSTFILYYSNGSPEVVVTGVATVAKDAVTESSSGIVETMSGMVESYLPIVFNVWILGFILVSIKMMGGWIYVERLKRRVSKEVPGHYHQIVSRIKSQMGVRKKILVGISERVAVPIIAGYIKPIVLIPLGLVNQMTDKEIEAILAHEIAHIKRHDYLFNLIQSAIETILYFNPAVWWISSAVRNTREHCCDDMAIKICQNQVLYAGALVKAEELKESVKLRRPYALSLLGQKENLLMRIKRILQQPEKNAIAMEKILMSAGLLLCMVFFNIDQNNKQADVEQVLVEGQYLFNTTLPTVTVKDTLPNSIVEKITRKEDDKEVEATYENGVLTKLKINGETIPEDQRDRYQEEISQLERDRMTPGSFNFNGLENLQHLKNLEHLEGLRSLEDLHFSYPDMPDFEDFNFEFDDEMRIGIQSDGGVFQFNGDAMQNIRIETEESEDGTMIMKIQRDGEEPMEIEIDAVEENEVIIIDGSEIRMGDATRILDDVQEFHGFRVSPEGQEVYIERMKESREAMEDARKEMAKVRKEQMKVQKEYFKNIEKEQRQLREEAIIRADELRALNEEEIARIKEEMEVARGYTIRGGQGDEDYQIIVDGQASGFNFNSDENQFFLSRSNDLNTTLENALIRDGIIDEGEEYSLKFSGGKLKINGKKQSDEIYEKYKEIYESKTGTDISKSKIIIEN